MAYPVLWVFDLPEGCIQSLVGSDDVAILVTRVLLVPRRGGFIIKPWCGWPCFFFWRNSCQDSPLKSHH